METTKLFFLVLLLCSIGTLVEIVKIFSESEGSASEGTSDSPETGNDNDWWLNSTTGESSEEDDTDACDVTGWNYQDLKCPEEHPKEMYRDVDIDDDSYRNRMCCNMKHGNFKRYRNTAYTCRTTSCKSKTVSNLCATLDPRFVRNGTIELQYEEILRESCRKKKGRTALCCVKNSIEGILVTSLGAEPNEFPHQAKLRLPGHCGGTVYNSKFIVTAAHCVVDEDEGEIEKPDEMEVILGSNIGDIDANEYMYKVKRLIVHPDFSFLKTSPEFELDEPRYYNDIALMELTREIQFGVKVKALEIAPKDFNPLDYAERMIVVGWGTTDTLEVAAHLQKIDMLIRGDQSCFIKEDGPHDEMNGMESQLLCLGGILEGKWSATAGGGDSGGPAICRGPNGRALLCGVTSFGGDDDLCSQHNNETSCPPSVYAEVAYFHDWIKENAGEQNSSTFFQPFVYGKNMNLSEHEHQVHITSFDGKPCGGTLIAPDVVVTAAQCAVKSDGSGDSLGNIVITTGLNEVNDVGESYRIQGVAALPGFKRGDDLVEHVYEGNRIMVTDNYYKNDLAVIKLERPTNISPEKFPRLPLKNETFKYSIEMSFLRNTTYSAKMNRREFKILKKENCQSRFDRMSRAGMNLTINDNVLCGVERYSGGSLCDRELGGALICKGGSGEFVLCGVQIFRLCELSIPNAFINMAVYSDWVRRAMSAL